MTNKIINVQDLLGRSALHLSIQRGNIQSAELIIQLGANVNAALNVNNAENEGKTPLIEASSHGYLSIAKKLVVNGAKVDAQQKDGTTATFIAAKNGHWNTFEYLSSLSNVKVDTKDENGGHIAYYAARDGKLDVLKLLV